jgi:hypothetical protein
LSSWPAHEVVSDLEWRATGGGQGPAGLEVQRPTDRHSHVLVESLSQEVMAKRQPFTVVDDDARSDGLIHDGNHRIEGASAYGGQVDGREATADDGGPAKQR